MRGQSNPAYQSSPMLLAYRMVVKQEAQGRDHGEGSSFLIQLLLMIWQIWKCMGTYVFFAVRRLSPLIIRRSGAPMWLGFGTKLRTLMFIKLP